MYDIAKKLTRRNNTLKLRNILKINIICSWVVSNKMLVHKSKCLNVSLHIFSSAPVTIDTNSICSTNTKPLLKSSSILSNTHLKTWFRLGFSHAWVNLALTRSLSNHNGIMLGNQLTITLFNITNYFNINKTSVFYVSTLLVHSGSSLEIKRCQNLEINSITKHTKPVTSNNKLTSHYSPESPFNPRGFEQNTNGSMPNLYWTIQLALINFFRTKFY